MLDFLNKIHETIRSSSFKRKGAQAIEELCSYIDSHYVSFGRHLDEVCHLYLAIATCSAEYSYLACIRESLLKCWSNPLFNQEEFVFVSILLGDSLRYLQESDEPAIVKNIRLVIASRGGAETSISFDSATDFHNLVTFYNLIWCDILPKGDIDMGGVVRLAQYVNIQLDSLSSSNASVEHAFVLASRILVHFPMAFTTTYLAESLRSSTYRLNFILSTYHSSSSSSEIDAILTFLTEVYPLATRSDEMKRIVMSDLQLAAADLSTALYSSLPSVGQANSNRAALEQCALWACLIVSRVTESPLLAPCTPTLYDTLFCHVLNTTQHFQIWNEIMQHVVTSLSSNDIQAISSQCSETYLSHSATRDQWSGSDIHPMEVAVHGNATDGFSWLMIETCLETTKLLVAAQVQSISILNISILVSLLFSAPTSSSPLTRAAIEDLIALSLHALCNERYSRSVRDVRIVQFTLQGIVQLKLEEHAQGGNRFLNVLRKDLELCRSISAALAGSFGESDVGSERRYSSSVLFQLMDMLVALEEGQVINQPSTTLTVFTDTLTRNNLQVKFLLFALPLNGFGADLMHDRANLNRLLYAAKVTETYLLYNNSSDSSTVDSEQLLWQSWRNVLEGFRKHCIAINSAEAPIEASLRAAVECLVTSGIAAPHSHIASSNPIVRSAAWIRLCLNCEIVALYYSCLASGGEELQNAATPKAMYRLCGYVVATCLDVAAQDTTEYSLRCLLSDQISKSLVAMMQRVYVDELRVSRSKAMETLDSAIETDQVYIELRDKVLGVLMNGTSYTLFLSVMFMICRHCLSRRLNNLACWAFVQAMLFRDSCAVYMVDDPLFFPFLQEEVESLSDCKCLSSIDDNLQYVVDKLLIPLLRVFAASPARHKNSAHAETVLTILLDCMFRSKGVGKASVSPSSYFRNIWRCSRLVAGVCGDSKLVDNISDAASSKRIRQFLHNRLEVPVPHDYFLKDLSLVVVFLLLSNEMQQHSVGEIVQGKLSERLQYGAQFFQLQSISRDDTNTERSTISLILFHQVLLPLVWTLGSEDEEESRQGRKSILALCCCFVHDSWLVDKKRMSERHFLQHTQKELPRHFLHIMSSLLQHHWASQTAPQQCQNLRALRCLVSILLPEDVTKYLPKILTMIESALTDFSRPSVQLSAVSVVVTLVNCLSKELLADNLYEMLIFLFPVIEASSARLDPTERRTVTVNSSLAAAEQHAEHNSAMLDLAFPCSQEGWQQGDHAIVEAKSLAVQLLCDIFANELDLVVRLPYLPRIDDLSHLRAHLDSKLSPLTLPERIKRLNTFLTSNRIQVIYAGLVTFREVIKRHKSEILKACVQQRLNLINISGDNSIVHEVSNLIVSLVNIATRQQNSRILVLCSACLGDIGALHPSLLAVGEEGVVVPTSKSSTPPLSPLHLDTLSFGLQVLTEYIVPGLKAAQGSSEQDKSAFAAQEVLRFLARYLDGYDDEDDSKMAEAKLKQLPGTLKNELLKKGVYEIVEPFWHSKYIQKPNERMARSSTGSSGNATQASSLTLTASMSDSRKGSYYSRSKSFHLWLAAWSRNLITMTQGNLKTIFLACRGMLHTSVELCQFLLPYLILDVAVNSTAHASLYLTELNTVLQSCKKYEEAGMISLQRSINFAVNETDRKAIQFVFTLLDIMTAWHADAQKQLLKLAAVDASAGSKALAKSSGASKAGSVLSKSSDDDRNPGNNKELISHTRDALENILNALPADDLSESALRIHAYARTIRYIESFAKDRYFRNGNHGTQRNQGPALISSSLPLKRDMHVYDDYLPILSRQEANSLSSAFAKLGDTDSLQGVRAVTCALSEGSASSFDNILWYEQQSDWFNALLEYEFLQGSHSYRAADGNHFNGFGDNHTSSGIRSGVRRNKRLRLDENESSRITADLPVESSPSVVISMHEVASIQRGKLRCLIELEQLEAVVTALQVQIASDVFVDSVVTESTLSLGIEAAWKLSDWSKLDSFLGTNDCLLNSAGKGERSLGFVDSDDMYQVQFGQLLSHIHARQFDRVPAVLDQARLLAMGSFSAASMESYERAYPYLLRLHCLSDVEDVYHLLKEGESKVGTLNLVDEVENNLHWNQRLDCMSETISARCNVLATHRSLYSLFDSVSNDDRLRKNVSMLLGSNRIYLSTYLKELGKYDLALTALKYARQCGVSEEEVILRKGKLLLEQGLIREALSVVEPTEVDARALLQVLKGGNAACPYLHSEQKKIALSEKLFLATQCLVTSQQCQGAVIIDRYHAITALTPRWDKPYLHFAKYYEYLFIQYNGSGSRHHSAGRTNNISVVLSDVISGGSSTKDFSLIEHAIRQYGNCLSVCSDLVTIAEVLPRMLTLWLSFTALTSPVVSRRAGSADDSTSPLKIAQQRVNDIMKSFVMRVSSQVWYSSVAQLISRVLHPNASTVDVILNIITQCWLNYPKHTLWHTANLMNSFNAERKAIAKTLLRDVYKQFTNPSSPYYSKENAQMLADSQNFFRDLVQLACLQTKERRISFRIDKKVHLPNFLIPTKQVLLACANGSTADRITEFVEAVDVTNSKARPKVISLLSSSGHKVKFLCKQEKDGDLRKDAHMMEVNTLVNRLLGSSMGGRQRKLRVTTYGVICLHEECGLLEWVNNTECLRHLVNLSHSYDPLLYPNIIYKDIQQDVVNIQNRHDSNITAMTQAYRDLVASFHYRPCFSKWFLHRHTDPTAWLHARQRFAHSVAVWSAVGYLIGLGDRHTENILVSTRTCEAVHVDFDCLFDKGLMLLKPEIVPFRLTANMVDAMGVTGVEGVYRKALELTLSILREQSETFISVLEPFLRDPTVSWGRSGRAQRDDQDGTKQGAGHATDVENKEANDMLGKIADRLRGVFNLEHPHRERILRNSTASGGSIPDTGKGLGASKEDQLLPLSVEGLAQRLIDEATALENLAQLYVGWQPWV